MSDTQPFYHQYSEFLQPFADERWTVFLFPNGCEVQINRMERYDNGELVDRYYLNVFFNEDGVKLYWMNRNCGAVASQKEILKYLEHFKNLEVKI